MAESFQALVISEEPDGTFSRQVTGKTAEDLPQHDVLIRVKWSALNFKDALSSSGHKGITKMYPHTPGIDAAGIVEKDLSGTYTPGTEVIVTSYDLGMNTHGGFSGYIAVPPSWIIPLPPGLDLKQAAILGTAGFTAGLALYKMEINGQQPEMGPVLVSGSTGGVGSMAVSLLYRAGYRVIASTGKLHESDYLRTLGASEIIHRSELQDNSSRPFLKTRWAGAIDTVGGNTLATILKSTGHNGNIATCGLVEKADFSTTVYPFIIKGNNLLGIESAECNRQTRLVIWSKLAGDWKFNLPEEAVQVTNLGNLTSFIDKILQGHLKGRVLVNPWD